MEEKRKAKAAEKKKAKEEKRGKRAAAAEEEKKEEDEEDDGADSGDAAEDSEGDEWTLMINLKLSYSWFVLRKWYRIPFIYFVIHMLIILQQFSVN